MVLAALLAPIIAQYDPIAMRIRFRFRPPQAAFPFGTDQFGRDVFSRVVYGTRLSLWIGLATALISGVFGAFLGVLSAQYRKFDALLMRVMDALMAVPGDPAGDRADRGARARIPPASSSRCRSPISRAPRASCAARRW